MPMTAVGSLVFDGVTLTTDPATYEPTKWVKRHSVHPVIGGRVVIQDFGMFAKDDTIKLASGSNHVLDETVVAALHARYRTRGATYTLTDWLLNNFTVFMKDFQPVPWKQGANRAGATTSLYTYTLDLHVLTIVNLFGAAYTGS